MSTRLGYDDWKGLLQRLHKAAPIPQTGRHEWRTDIKSLEDILWRAEFYRRKLDEGTYQRVLRKHFDDRKRENEADSSARRSGG